MYLGIERLGITLLVACTETTTSLVVVQSADILQGSVADKIQANWSIVIGWSAVELLEEFGLCSWYVRVMFSEEDSEYKRLTFGCQRDVEYHSSILKQVKDTTGVEFEMELKDLKKSKL